jgi:adenylate cyclase
MISEAVYEQVKSTCFCRHLDVVAVKGRTQETRIYELLSDHVGIISLEVKKLILVYEEGMKLYTQGSFEAALENFNRYSASRPNDLASKVLVQRCQALIANPPTAWNGIYAFEHK